MYSVTFKYSDYVFCSNIAIGNYEDVKRHYEEKGYSVISIREATEGEFNTAQRKGMPIVRV